MVRSARRHRLAVRITRVAALVAMSTPASLVASAAAPDQPGGPGANGTVALIGHQDHGQAEAAAVLEEAGIEIAAVVEHPRDTTDVAAVAGADLVLLTVSAADGPMPGTRQVLADLDGVVMTRVAVLLTRTDVNTDPELIDLVELEILELAEGHGLPPSVPVLTAEAPSFVDDVVDLLSAPAGGGAVVAPTTTVPTTSWIPGVDGLGLGRATRTLEAEGLEVTVIADPSLPVEVRCAPPVRRQVPEPGLSVPRGTTVAVISGLRASSLGCDLPVLSADELDEAIDAVWDQPGLPPRYVTMPVVTNNIPLSSAVDDLQALGLVVDAVPTAGNFGRNCDPAVDSQVPEAGAELERGMRVLLTINVDLDYSSTPEAPDCRWWDAVSLDELEQLTAAVLEQ